MGSRKEHSYSVGINNSNDRTTFCALLVSLYEVLKDGFPYCQYVLVDRISIMDFPVQINSKFFSVSAGLFLFVTFSSAIAETPRVEKTLASCEAFVQNFYDWYAPIAHDDKRRGRAWDVALKEKIQVFDAKLAKDLAEDSAAQEKSKDDIVGLDWDPFLNSQDPAPKYKVVKIVVLGDKCNVDVRSQGDNSQKQPEADISPELIFKDKSWKFVNFFDKNAKKSQTNDLVNALKNLRDARKK
jgi:hypothetical protein